MKNPIILVFGRSDKKKFVIIIIIIILYWSAENFLADFSKSGKAAHELNNYSTQISQTFNNIILYNFCNR